MPAAPLNTEGQPSFDICQRGSWEFLWYSHPSERNHWNHHLLWNSFAPLTPDATNQSTSHPEDYWLVYSMCVSERAQMSAWSYEHMHIWFSVCDPACLLGGPGARGTWRIAFPAEEGAGAAVRKHAGEERDLLSAEDRPWLAVFSEKPPHAPEGDNNFPNAVWLSMPRNLQT